MFGKIIPYVIVGFIQATFLITRSGVSVS